MLIVNITTTKSRLDLCCATVFSLYNQKLQPDIINVWVSKEKYMADDGIVNIPSWVDLINNDKNIVNFIYTPNTGPYRKIFPALEYYSNDDKLVYADDDVVYGSLWLDYLVTAYESNNSESVVASRVRMKERNIFNKYKSYSTYSLCNENVKLDKDFIITGVGGCILSKKHIREEFISNKDYLEVSPRTDDLWISKIIEISGSDVLVCTDALNQVFEIEHSCSALNHINNIKYNSIFFNRVLKKIYVKFFGYLGCAISNNDKSQRVIDNYFKGEVEKNN